MHRPWGQNRRLRKRADFQVVLGEGRSWANRLVVLRARPNGTSFSRVGFSVGRRVGKAVVRNRVKRRLREAVRNADLEEGWDLVFIARGPAAKGDFRQLQQAAQELLSKLSAERVFRGGKEESE